MNPTDPIWHHFSKIWPDLQAVDPGILLIGGYGLLLKQEWLIQLASKMIVVPFERWGQPVARVTRDMDLVISLDVLADEERNKEILSVIQCHGFTDSHNLGGRRWKFVKDTGTPPLILELHAEKPSGQPNLTAQDGHRVKHKPSLGERGVHGRENPQALGSHLNPFHFEVGGIPLALPNPVTWSIMKLVAADDNHQEYQKASTERDRKFHLEKAGKHAADVYRIIALLGPEEMASAPQVASKIKGHTVYQQAAAAFRNSFSDDSWALARIRQDWASEDVEVIQSTLKDWLV